MNALLLEYLPILIFLAIALGLGLAFILAAAVAAPSNPDPEKVSASECGLKPPFCSHGQRVSVPSGCSASGR